ncbi:MAG: insulinase family protein [Actinobacteria bacterium]|nr:insulinase family protein [Actinomycetota bacterium]
MTARRRPSTDVLALSNGVPVLVRRRSGSPVTTVSLWVLVGSRHESAPGVTHLVEHVLMQATPPGRAMRVTDQLEACGGEANAVTSRDHLALYARVPSPDAPAALLVLAESLTQTDFAEDLIDSERRVVDEELRLAASDPNDVVHDVFFSTAFGNHPMGRPVGGRPAQIAALTPAHLAEWAATNVHAGRAAVVVSGDVDPDAVCSLLADGPVGALAAGDGPAPPAQDGPVAAAGRQDLAVTSETAAVILGGPGYPLSDPRLPAAEVLIELVAGSNSSLLSNEIRASRGLSYDVWGAVTGYRDTGVWRVGMSTSPEHRHEVVELARDVLDKALVRRWSVTEVAAARRRVAGRLRLEAESSLDDALLLGRYQLVGGAWSWSLEHHAEALGSVTVTGVEQCARHMLSELVVATAGG